MVRLEAEELQQRLNAKQNRKTTKVTVISATGWLTLADGKELHKQQEAV
jgi:hypothetical protein